MKAEQELRTVDFLRGVRQGVNAFYEGLDDLNTASADETARLVTEIRRSLRGDRGRDTPTERNSMTEQTTKRRAKVRGFDIQQNHQSLSAVAAYLPYGYLATGVGTDDLGEYVLIEGVDFAGWTLDGYVIPRLASANLIAEEIEQEEPESADDERINGTEITIIASAFGEGKTWTGRVHLDDLLDGEPEKQLERIFRRFNRVDEGDVRWLNDKGYNLPSMSMGDVVVLHGQAWQAKGIGWEPFTVAPVNLLSDEVSQ